jgi:hypothetical protein
LGDLGGFLDLGAYGALRRRRVTEMAEGDALTLSSEQLAELLRLLKGADSVELKVSVPEGHRRSVIAALGMDPLEAQMRHVVFFDTPELTLNEHGVVVRARRIQHKPGDSVIKLRPLDPSGIPAALRKAAGFGVEVDAMPGGFVCSGRLKVTVDDMTLKDVFAGRSPVRKLFGNEQRQLYAAHAPAGVELDDLAVLGPIYVHKLRFEPADYGRRLVAELWTYPDGSRILELSTRCATGEAFQVAAETGVYLTGHGIDLRAQEHTKTKAALEFFAQELAATAATD